ncbi:MAG: hypothetical protein JSS30_06230 [Verrucomicrobia bacterium]|nr:hypothetical protein [Verrucomicrobiota bacterium]
MTGLTFVSGKLIADALDSSKYFNGKGRISYQLSLGMLSALSIGVIGAWVGIGSSTRDNPDFVNIALKAALVTAPVLYSLSKRTQVLVYSSLKAAEGDVVVDGDIKDSNGKSINRDFMNYKMSFLGNQPFDVKQTDVPEYLLNRNPTETPLRVFYKGYPVEVIPNNFKCTKIKFHNALDEWDPAGLLTQADGSKIVRKPNERLVELEFGENAIQKKGYLPESFARSLTPGQPLELKYRGIPILITMAPNCANELPLLDEEYDPYDEKRDAEICKILNGSGTTDEKDLQILTLLYSLKK